MRAWVITAFIVLGGCAESDGRAVPVSPPASAAMNDLSDDAVKDGAWLMQRVKAIADTGALLDADRTGRLLALKFKPPNPVGRELPCTNRSGAPSDITVGHYPEDTWLKPTDRGIQQLQIPAVAINAAGVSGNPGFRYDIVERYDCSRAVDAVSQISAKLTLWGLPSFACITFEQLRGTIGGDYRPATDGYSYLHYTGKVEGAYGTGIAFGFRASVPCALSIEVEQTQSRGHRWQRARIKFDECQETARVAFCATNGPFDGSDRERVQEMQRAQFGACGTFNAVFQAEPLDGPQPRPNSVNRWPRLSCSVR